MSKQKGVSLYLSIMIMVILLSIVLGMSGILLGQLKMIKGMENSVIAFYAAETGIERVLKIAFDSGGSCTPPTVPDCSDPADECYLDLNDSGDLDDGDATYGILDPILPGEDCNGACYCIKVQGNYKGIKRAIKLTL